MEALNADPIADRRRSRSRRSSSHLESVVGALEKPPILIGHSAGGTSDAAAARPRLRRGRRRPQLRPDRGRRGSLPLSQLKSTFTAFKNPANRHRAVGLHPEQWHYAFTNTFSDEESRALYERYHIPASGRILWDRCSPTSCPGPQDAAVDYRKPDRAPLLFISGGEDHIMPPSIQRSNVKHYKSGVVPSIRSTPGTRTCCRPRRGGRRSPTTRWTGRSSHADMTRQAAGQQ